MLKPIVALIINDKTVLLFQIIIGAFQATGWPAVVAVIGNWVGKGR